LLQILIKLGDDITPFRTAGLLPCPYSVSTTHQRVHMEWVLTKFSDADALTLLSSVLSIPFTSSFYFQAAI